MPEFLEAWHANAGIDLLIGRWIADYDDPDNFTHDLFHSETGRLRAYFSSSPEPTAILEEARAERRPAAREGLYRKFEHDAARRRRSWSRSSTTSTTGSPARRSAASSSQSTAPYVNYADLGKAAAPTPDRRRRRPTGGGILHVPIQGVVRSLDPSLDRHRRAGATSFRACSRR